MPPHHSQTLDDYLAQFTSEQMIDTIASSEGIDRAVVAEMMPQYAAEARYGWHSIAPHLPRDGKILEIGSGLGMLSGYLRLMGYNVTPLEPYATGFDLFAKILSVLTEQALIPVPMNIRAEELSPKKHGPFDFIFSVNVIEHIPDLDIAMVAMLSVLAPTGRMWHTCPNYIVPYEPHFGVPLIPFFPHATAVFLPKRIKDSDLWQSLNFITMPKLRSVVRAQGATATFRRGMMAEALSRLDSDPAFASRHKGFVMFIYRILKFTGLLKLFGLLPSVLNTPMAVEIRPEDAGEVPVGMADIPPLATLQAS